MFERFTKEARQVVTKAAEEARNRGDGRIGTVHLLLGVFDSPPAQSPILSQLGLSADLLRQGLSKMGGEALLSVGIDPELAEVEAPDTRSPMRRRRHIPFTGAAKEVLERALHEAISLDHRSIGAEHIVLGLTRLPPQDRASRLLRELGVGQAEVRETLLASMRQAS